MTGTKIRNRLQRKIDCLSTGQLNEVMGIIENYFQERELKSEWEKLPSPVKDDIDIGIKELDEGKGIPHPVAMKQIRAKYARKKV
ncbi:MAG TPA: hypothetical protein VE978_15255 [Chitinophagales bacterium]|nr:hypothetical protein [Chitinophagales bacterium]